jgi:hypothetical protein
MPQKKLPWTSLLINSHTKMLRKIKKKSVVGGIEVAKTMLG